MQGCLNCLSLFKIKLKLLSFKHNSLCFFSKLSSIVKPNLHNTNQELFKYSNKLLYQDTEEKLPYNFITYF